MKVKCLINGYLQEVDFENSFSKSIKAQAKFKIALAAKFGNSEIIIL